MMLQSIYNEIVLWVDQKPQNVFSNNGRNHLRSNMSPEKKKPWIQKSMILIRFYMVRLKILPFYDLNSTKILGQGKISKANYELKLDFLFNLQILQITFWKSTSYFM